MIFVVSLLIMVLPLLVLAGWTTAVIVRLVQCFGSRGQQLSPVRRVLLGLLTYAIIEPMLGVGIIGIAYADAYQGGSLMQLLTLSTGSAFDRMISNNGLLLILALKIWLIVPCFWVRHRDPIVRWISRLAGGMGLLRLVWGIGIALLPMPLLGSFVIGSVLLGCLHMGLGWLLGRALLRESTHMPPTIRLGSVPPMQPGPWTRREE